MVSALDHKIKLKTKIDPKTGCHIWTGPGSGDKPPRPLLTYTKDRESNLRHIVWQKAGRTLEPNQTLWTTCKNGMCINIEHITALGPHEVLKDDKVVVYDEDLYKYLPCDWCQTPARVRGKKIVGETRARIVETGERLCGRCSRSYGQRKRWLDRPLKDVYDGNIEELQEEIEFLLDAGEIMENVASRLGFNSEQHLYDVLKNLGRRDLLKRFSTIGVINSDVGTPVVLYTRGMQ